MCFGGEAVVFGVQKELTSLTAVGMAATHTIKAFTPLKIRAHSHLSPLWAAPLAHQARGKTSEVSTL